ncbi:phosphotransferase [Kribbella sp. NPDC055071]
MPPLDPAQLAASAIGPVTRVEPVNGFVGNQNFRLVTSTGVYYLKAGGDVVAEVSACALARSVDVPVPDVVAFDLTSPAYLITAEVQPIETLDRLDGILPTELAERILAVVPSFIERVTPVLLHGDLHPRHVFALSNKLTGIIDWGDAHYGDPLYDLARFSMARPAANTALRAGYGPIDTSDQTLSLYRVIWSLKALQAEQVAGGDWFHPHIDTIRQELTR